jgi:hypothetical protein
MPFVLASTRQTNSFLLMRVLWTVEQHTVAELGQYVAEEQLVKLSSAVDVGMLYLLQLQEMIANILIRFSVLPALSLTEGIMHCDIIEGAFDSSSFLVFIERLLDRMQPYPAPNSVIVMDNCRIHKSEDILELIESR